MLRKIGVQVISINEPFDDTPTGKLMEGVIESLDEFYSANLAEEVTRGMRESASRGFYVHSFAPHGMRKIMVQDGAKQRPKLEPEPGKAEGIARMFREADTGRGLKEIIKGITGDGIPSPRGKGWIKTTLYGILTNEAYTGTLVWGKRNKHGLPPVRVEKAWPAIVDRETFDRVQKVLKSRSFPCSHPRRTASPFLLSGIARCGHCAKALVGSEAKSGKFSYYVCGSLLKKGSGACEAKYLSAKALENAVISKIKEHILTRENLEKLVRMVNEDMDKLSGEQRDQLATVEHTLADINGRLERLYDVLESGKAQLEDLMPRIQQHKSRLEKLRETKAELEMKLSERKIELADAKTVAGYVDELREMLSESSIVERKSFVKSFVKQIEVKGNEALLTYTIPMPPKGTTEEKTGVLSTVHYGGRYWT